MFDEGPHPPPLRCGKLPGQVSAKRRRPPPTAASTGDPQNGTIPGYLKSPSLAEFAGAEHGLLT